ncbi:MAG: HAD hydrolase-like protein [Ferruginibacter sp.]
MINKYKVIFFDIGDTLVSSTKTWLPGALELISKLKQDNLRLGIISNTGQLNRDQLAQLLPADFSWSKFEKDLIILSSEVNTEKPQIEIFKLATHRSGIDPHFSLFCSENSLDCLVAQQAGLHSFHLQKSPSNDINQVYLTLEQLNEIILLSK